MGVVMERWCPTQQMLGVFLRRLLVKKLLLIGSAVLLTATSALAQSRVTYSMYLGSCNASSFATCRYRANLRRTGEYTYRRAHNGNWSPAFQKRAQRVAQKCSPATVWWDECH